MSRRHLTLIVLTLATFAVAACADAPTGPSNDSPCSVLAGNGTLTCPTP